MCGIAGFVESRPHDWSSAELTLSGLAIPLRHRGPDDLATQALDEGVGFAHTRLAVIDVSAAGAQPMTSTDRRWTVTYNGEIYNHIELRRELEAVGHRFRGASDTEVLVEGLSRWGVRSTLERCNGMFAFGAWDATSRRLVLARDRLGEKPLYYGYFDGVTLFASEIKALFVHPAFRPRVDLGSVAEYLRLGCVPAPWTIFEGLRKLPPASYVEVDPVATTTPEPVRYWELSSLDSDEADLEPLLRDSVRRRLVADVPVGTFLSGGIDSTVISLLAAQEAPGRLRTFTLGFDEAGFDESSLARRVATLLSTDHTEIHVSPSDVLAVVPDLPHIYDEPFGDSSQVNLVLVSRLARRDVTVALSGDGGDELYAGYNRHVWANRVWQASRRVPYGVRRGVADRVLATSPDRLDRALRPLGAVLGARFKDERPGERLHKLALVVGAQGSTDVHRRLVSVWSGTGIVRGGDHNNHPLPPAFGAEHVGAGDAMLRHDLMNYLPDDILVKVDRASMSVGLEARAPFLDHRVVEHAFGLPFESKIDQGRGKAPLRRLLGRYLPADVVDRSKLGFAVPVGSWMRGPLRGWAEDLLSARHLDDVGLVNPAPVRSAWADHLAGRGGWDQHLWIVLMLQAWSDRWMSETGPA